jgi:hypothetical protein
MAMSNLVTQKASVFENLTETPIHVHFSVAE